MSQSAKKKLTLLNLVETAISYEKREMINGALDQNEGVLNQHQSEKFPMSNDAKVSESESANVALNYCLDPQMVLPCKKYLYFSC